MDEKQSRRQWLATSVSLAGMALASSTSSGIAFGQANKTIGVRVVDKAGYDKVIAANKGKVVVVDCWATWCAPCRKAFPKTIELSNTYANKDVVVVTLSFDDLKKGQAPDSVKQFLAMNEAYCENLISSLDIAGEGADTFEIPDGALPHFKIYGKDGKLFKAFESGEDKKFGHEDVEAAVKQALAAKSK